MKRIFLITSLLSVFGCELSLQSDITPDFGRPQLVINAILDTDSVFQATITINKPILEDGPFESVENATVTISDENGYAEILPYVEDGLYASAEKKPEPGKAYTIAVTAPGFETARATSYVPHPAQITYLRFGNPTLTNDYYNSPIDIDLKFNDAANEENFYEIMVASGDPYYDPIRQENVNFFSDVAVTQKGIQNDQTVVGNRLLIKDIFFNGKEATLALSTNITLWYGSVSAIVLRTVSKEYYDYVVTSKLHTDVKNNPFAQPVNVATNIENGLGLFAGHSNSKQIIVRPLPVIASFTPTQGRRGDIVTIFGENFVTGATVVRFDSNGPQYGHAQIEEMSDKHIKVIIPNDANTGHINVQIVNNGVSSSDIFTVIN
jgi:hypothetical protein